MPDTFKTLAQTNPAAATLTTHYTVPASTSTTVSSIFVCNTSSTKATFRISIAIAAAADATTQYLYYDLPLTGNNTFVATVGLTLATTDLIRVQASTSGVVFSSYGVEVT